MSIFVGLISITLLMFASLAPFSSKTGSHPLLAMIRPTARIIAVLLIIYMIYFNISERGFLKTHKIPQPTEMAGVWAITGRYQGIWENSRGFMSTGQITIFTDNTFTYESPSIPDIQGNWSINNDFLLLNFKDKSSIKIKISSFSDTEMTWFINKDDNTFRRNFTRIKNFSSDSFFKSFNSFINTLDSTSVNDKKSILEYRQNLRLLSNKDLLSSVFLDTLETYTLLMDKIYRINTVYVKINRDLDVLLESNTKVIFSDSSNFDNNYMIGIKTPFKETSSKIEEEYKDLKVLLNNEYVEIDLKALKKYQKGH